MRDVLLYLWLVLVFLWTVRLARSKGRNPWVWGGASLALMALPLALPPDWRLLNLAPLAILLFLTRKTQPQVDQKRNSVACPRCQTPHTNRDRYCFNCGWELGTPYTEPAPAREDSPTAVASQARVEPAAPNATAAPGGTPPLAGPPSGKGPVEPAPTPPPEPPVQETGPVAQEPAPIRTPTAAGMTERGMARFDQGRFQEAIDQFTKAIALDPQYKPAWAHRAEAYAKLGRSKEAAQDTIRLQAI